MTDIRLYSGPIEDFRRRCPHCKSVNWGPWYRRVKGRRWSKRWITHAADCPLRGYYSKGSR
jgi:hypothetical protein